MPNSDFSNQCFVFFYPRSLQFHLYFYLVIRLGGQKFHPERQAELGWRFGEDDITGVSANNDRLTVVLGTHEIADKCRSDVKRHLPIPFF